MAKLNINQDFLMPVDGWDEVNLHLISDEQKKTNRDLHKEANGRITTSRRQYADAYHKASSYLSD
jgi:hypothetical protein